MVRDGLRWLVVGLCLVPSAAGPVLAQPADVVLPDVRRAERDLERARWELEEIVGSRLLRLDPPPLPAVPRAGLSVEERSLMARLNLAQLALALRLDAVERGSYAADLEGIASGLGLAPEETAALAYERRPGGGARLRLASDRVVTDGPESHRELLRPLLTWDLPPV